MQVKHLNLKDLSVSFELDSLEQYALRCLKHIPDLTDSEPKKEKIYDTEAAELIKTWFAREPQRLTFYQVQSFLRFLGSQMKHFEGNPFLSVETITTQYQHFIDTKLREEIARRCVE